MIISKNNGKDVMNNIGEKIKELRERKKLSQQRFGNKIGISAKSISAYENGRCLPPLKVLDDICETYSTPYLCLSDKGRNMLSSKISEIRKELENIEKIIGNDLSL